MNTHYKLKNIRTLLNEGFTSEELRQILYEDFRPVYDHLAPNSGKAEIVSRLVEYANQKLQMATLLTLAKEHNPARYEIHQPYYDVITNPLTVSKDTGDFSGIYLAITRQLLPDEFLIEIVQCQQVGSQLEGKISRTSFVQLNNDELVEISRLRGSYSFSGTVNERLFVLSYYTNVRGAKAAGSLTLQGDYSGKVFEGIWAGFEQGYIIGTRCMWIRVNKKLASPVNREALLKEAKKFLYIYYVQSSEEETPKDPEVSQPD